ncbi:ATP-dependent DNA helicase Q4 isoform X1 [Neodiprion virginianus]|uniref:ATP-dependent DNA helicase Q4 isoform X1 n=2 Tax=Neodiprion virginianus TaxID=2961670 RepID=UPI001EE6C240|nr:ATP-dependent DNA helicase Q4 isoform X1 [Neodiprion virginianus]XP_046604661.1 ATP-dependent DNA helicase Q4 isoform X1 [Neodiprion virginianus]
MDLLDDRTLKNKYQKSKLRVKLWESDFMEKYGRKPNKNDIKDADVTIRDAYKMYWKLKTRALEATLTDITFSDDIQANISTTSTLNTSAVENDCNKHNTPQSDTRDSENLKPESVPAMKNSEFEAVPFAEGLNPDGAWGDHLNKKKLPTPKKKQNLLVGRSSSFQLSQKMFNSTSFTKRNPRKSLSMVKSKSRSELENSNTSLTSLKDSTANKAEDGFDPSDIFKPMFGDKMKVVQAENKVVTQSVSAIRQLIDGKTINVCRKIDAGWIDRCSKQNNLEPLAGNMNRLSGTSDSGVESLEASLYSPYYATSVTSSQTPQSFSDEEDFICNSDSEGERKNKRIRNKRKSYNAAESQMAKRPCIHSYQANSQHFTTPEDPSQNLSHSERPADVVKIDAKQELITRTDESGVRKTNKEDIIDVTRPSPADEKNKSLVVETEDPLPENSLPENPPLLNRQTRGTVYRSIKHNVVNDTETVDNDVKDKKKIVGKPRRTRVVHGVRKQPTRSVKKKNDETDSEDENIGNHRETADDDVEEEKEIVRKPRRTQAVRGARKQLTRNSKKKIDETDSVDENVRETPIYGVETVNAVPRFSLPTVESGDLVADFSQIIANEDSKNEKNSSTGIKLKKKLTDKEKLEQKVAAGNINENFVRINLKKKVFVRGKKTMTFQKYKKNQWKQKKKELASGEGGLDLADLVEKKGVLTCFKCGDIGHFSKECRSLKSADLLPLAADEEPSEYPTLEEAAKMANEAVLGAHRNRLNLIPQTASRPIDTTMPKEKVDGNDVPNDSEEPEAVLSNDENLTDNLDDLDFEEDLEYQEPKTHVPSSHKVPEHLLAQLLRPEVGPVKPLYPMGSIDEPSVTPNEVLEALKKFGHESFRPGQEKAVMRILTGQSTLVTLSTGSGKSLCYQLPAYLYAKHSPCITLVISPLVSLMDDQVTGVPKFLSAACLHTAMGAKHRTKVMDMVKEGTLNILLVSPEAVVAGEKSTGFGALLRQLPPIAFACIDEAHCISQWSHNFRPSYLMVSKVLREKLGVKTVLGLTATATKSTAESIVNHLRIPDGMAGVISDTPLPRNLTLTVSKDAYRDRALVALLESGRFKDLDSIIVYCTRRDECVRLAALLRTSLFNPKRHSRADEKVSAIAEAYHAGLSASRRKVVQKAFMSGETRIVVATVAFGMGINKPDIRAVIHFNMPSSFEGYVQEVGRSGRDGLPAHCHLFISSQEAADKSELRRHIYANGVDRHMVRRLLQKVFVPCSCTKIGSQYSQVNKRCPGHEVAIPVDETVKLLDIPQEIISTLLCYLELHPKKFITSLPSVYVNAKVTSYAGPNALKAAAQSSAPLAMAIALDLQRGKSHDDSSIIEFPVVDVAAAIGWDSGVVKGHLKDLEWKTTDTGGWKRSAISVTFDTLGFRVKAPGDLSNAELDEALDALADRAMNQQRTSLCQLESIYSALTEVGVDSVRQCQELTEELTIKSDTLKTTIRSYFQSENPMENTDLTLETKLLNEDQIASDVRSLVQCYRDNNFTGRAVARIFHGIQSPNYPAMVWSRCRFWRAHLASNFELICQVATREILAMR